MDQSPPRRPALVPLGGVSTRSLPTPVVGPALRTWLGVLAPWLAD
jgi:hypothetical protein